MSSENNLACVCGLHLVQGAGLKFLDQCKCLHQISESEFTQSPSLVCLVNSCLTASASRPAQDSILL